ncbi:hypothetical protein K4K52_005657 [Colletotrichum sp. SAR 10_76]|nr:hypothetical protein K4K52_005657 [Colletotrichum sp. SAR 10_76]
MSSHPAAAQIITAPDGWTTDPNIMDVSYYWGQPNVRGNAAAQDCRLDSPVPLMRLHPNQGGNQYLFTSSGKFYLWDLISGEVTIIVSPTGQDAVIRALGQIFTPAGAKELKVEPVLALAESD